MAFSVESRVPYLDQEFVDHILSLPEDAIVRARLEPLDPARGAQGHAAREDPPAPLEGRVHDAGDALDQGAPRGVHEPVPVAGVPGAPVLGRRRRSSSAFRACCRGEVEESMFFWRAANVELWLREFCDRSVVLEDADVEAALTRAGPVGPDAPRHASPRPATRACRRCWRRPRARRAPPRPPRPSACSPSTRPNDEKHLFAVAGGTRLRAPAAQDRPGRPRRRPRRRHAGAMWSPHVKPGDIVVMAEKPIAASQGRSYALDEIHPTRLAKHARARPSRKTPHGIGLGIPETMQLAIDEAGAPRIVAAAAASAAGKVARQARPLLQGRRRRRGGHRRPHAGTRCRRTTRTPSSARPTRTAWPRTWRRVLSEAVGRPRRVRRHRRQRPHGHGARRLAGRRPRARRRRLMRDNPLGPGSRADAGLRAAPARAAALAELTAAPRLPRRRSERIAGLPPVLIRGDLRH